MSGISSFQRRTTCNTRHYYDSRSCIPLVYANTPVPWLEGGLVEGSVTERSTGDYPDFIGCHSEQLMRSKWHLVGSLIPRRVECTGEKTETVLKSITRHTLHSYFFVVLTASSPCRRTWSRDPWRYRVWGGESWWGRSHTGGRGWCCWRCVGPRFLSGRNLHTWEAEYAPGTHALLLVHSGVSVSHVSPPSVGI